MLLIDSFDNTGLRDLSEDISIVVLVPKSCAVELNAVLYDLVGSFPTLKLFDLDLLVFHLFVIFKEPVDLLSYVLGKFGNVLVVRH